MLSCCTNYLAEMPDITVYMNCDTRLAINLKLFHLGENDEFIFAIKNYNYIDSPYVFIHRATVADIDDRGEILFKITPEISKQIKPGAFYNFSVLANAFDRRLETEYKKLTDNGNIIIEYGAQDLYTKPDAGDSPSEVFGISLEPVDSSYESTPNSYASGKIVGMRLEEVDLDV